MAVTVARDYSTSIVCRECNMIVRILLLLLLLLILLIVHVAIYHTCTGWFGTCDVKSENCKSRRLPLAS